MKNKIFKITENTEIASSVYRMRLCGDCTSLCPGQFVMVELPEFFLRRPISVCDVAGDVLTLIYKVVGDGTDYMSTLKINTELSVLSPLGNGYEPKETKKPLLVGGGVGVPPLLFLAKKLAQNGTKPVAVLGFNSACDVFLEKELAEVCDEVHITTIDGSYGTKGFVTDVVWSLEYDYFYACGPLPMLKALENEATSDGQVSHEERMGCGFGACMGCSCEKQDGSYARVCKEGPVFFVGAT